MPGKRNKKNREGISPGQLGTSFCGNDGNGYRIRVFSLLIIMAMAYKFDNALNTNTIILIGIIFSMFANAVISVVVTFASDKLKSITFWTMGSLSGSSMRNAAVLAVVLLAGSAIIMSKTSELNAFAIGEDNARNIGVDVRTVRILILVTVSALSRTSRALFPKKRIVRSRCRRRSPG